MLIKWVAKYMYPFDDISDIILSNTNNLSNINLQNKIANYKTFLRIIDTLNKCYFNIKTLYLGYNNIPKIYKLDLKYLQELCLRDNNIIDISNLKNLKNLINLNLKNNEITDISSLKYLNNLKKLNLSYNKIIDISCIKKLKNLIYLNLENNEITNISSLKYLKFLKELDLSYNKIKKLPIFINMTNLEDLDLKNNKISNINISFRKYFVKLWLKNNKIFNIYNINITVYYYNEKVKNALTLLKKQLKQKIEFDFCKINSK